MTNFTRGLLFLGDILFLNLAILLSSNLFEPNFELGATNNIYLLIFSNLVWLFLVVVSTPYNIGKSWSIPKILKSQLAFIFVHSIVVASLFFLFNKAYPIFQIVAIYLIFVPLFFLFRVLFFYLRKVMTKETMVKNYIIIGKNDLSQEVRRYFLMNPDIGYKFHGYFEFVSGKFDHKEIQKFCENKEIHEIYYCLPNAPKTEIAQLVNYGLSSLVKVKLIVEPNTPQQAISLEKYDVQPGLNLATIPLDDARNQFVKRIFDIFFSGIFMALILSWLVPLIGLIIKLDSKGPVFFVQWRSGEGNKPFKCLKFRSMKVNQEADTKQATKDDPRITKLGHFLRKSSIDELPQFLNVLGGSMSVVGPRPHMLKHTEEYSKVIEKFLGRHYVKPGITGLAQCMGYRGETKDLADMENRVRLDRHYIENWTFWLDIKIIFLTVVSLIRGSDKAY
ncbi:MAG: exopolysaccharide biosynthesis polyprenyl glycosylphosphotransferase [Cyclobacteriaceae bacterium]|nr:exopolysaccharide biosynthesis polyprenyl glycosylphosphotransferase [Cyclobacteriaceae bacterium]MCB0504896.1 exopolysaccharide biosynthesis polyprenyl glycosylphosphotransferase [Cyclobacteriaceae bacterium]MCB9238057.1 exopolysaccharide biosynthesis polyprenyl glycosylphosphotransferase [Flammeovirgaceae bacterium]MCO5272551.1 exopolysaccharide biosynthesis polyprenyl glycosylphosphotransferase [Cyclobacteriaceae bacterium]MCW5901619.1 exopolysaccharide biosynthesis polyprenyl glycosylpho